jgi:hypothetical protein
MLLYKKRFLENIQTVIKNMPTEFKELSDSKIQFIEQLRSFQKNFVLPMTENSDSNVPASELIKNIENTDGCLKKIEDNLKGKKSFYKLLKNIYDWVYKEIIDIAQNK